MVCVLKMANISSQAMYSWISACPTSFGNRQAEFGPIQTSGTGIRFHNRIFVERFCTPKCKSTSEYLRRCAASCGHSLVRPTCSFQARACQIGAKIRDRINPGLLIGEGVCCPVDGKYRFRCISISTKPQGLSKAPSLSGPPVPIPGVGPDGFCVPEPNNHQNTGRVHFH